MIVKLYVCRKCNSQNIVKNGHNASGSKQYKCKDCDAHGVLEPSRGYTEEQGEQIINDHYERSSLRGGQRVFGVSRPTLSKWLKKDESHPALTETLLPAQPTDELELDEMGSFVFKKSKNAGSGVLCVVAQDKSLLMGLGIEVGKLVANYGHGSRMSIKPVVVTVIFGTPMKKFSQKKLIEVLAKNREGQITWNDGIMPCDNPTLAMSARLYLSQKSISTMRWLLAFILSVTTCHLFINHYQLIFLGFWHLPSLPCLLKHFQRFTSLDHQGDLLSKGNNG